MNDQNTGATWPFRKPRLLCYDAMGGNAKLVGLLGLEPRTPAL